MARIGTFTTTADSYSGRLKTLTLDVELTLVPADAGDGETALSAEQIDKIAALLDEVALKIEKA